MKCQIIYGSKYNATKQNMLWIKERLELENNFEVELSQIKDVSILTDSKLLIFATGIYSGKAVEGFNDFIEKNKEQLLQKDLVFLIVAMNKENCFDETNNLKILQDLPQDIKDKIILQDGLLGEMIFQNLNEDDKISIDYFYKKIMNLEGEALKKALSPRTLLNKKDAWSVAENIIKLYKD